jgi:probable rRNA maturation factor
MRRINRNFLGHDYLTDVICFDYRDDTHLSDGDVAVEIFLSPDMAEIQAMERPDERSTSSELLLYLIHGILHATGELDSTPSEKRRIRRKEQLILNALANQGVTSID